MEQNRIPEPMHERIRRIVLDPTERVKVRADFTYTFEQLGQTPEQALSLTQDLFEILISDNDLAHCESAALKLLEEKGLINVLDKALSGRAEIIFNQIKTFAANIHGKILDYGTGDGQVAQLLHDRMGLEIEGADVRDYRKAEVTIPFRLITSDHIDVAAATYTGAILTNVLHHEANNRLILEDVTRLVVPGGWVIVLETVPLGETEEEMMGDKDRTFANDYAYNRLFHNADVPVPGTFETVSGWRTRFTEHGLELISEEDLGVDQPTIKDRHYLYVLKTRN